MTRSKPKRVKTLIAVLIVVVILAVALEMFLH